MFSFQKNHLRLAFLCSSILLFLFGTYLRFHHITVSEFFFYDEGLYLNLHREALEMIVAHLPYQLPDLFKAIYICLCLALNEGKALFIFFSHLRIFWGGFEDWYVPHVISAVFGTLTLVMTFIFAKRLFNSWIVGLLSAMVLCVLPSHVFYSRLALQEGMCGFFFLAGFYFYLFPRKLSYQTFISVLLLVMAYFSNYRLIILPVLVFSCELLASLLERRLPDIRKYFWHSLMFVFFVFMIGAINHGQNTVMTFAWMIYQARMAEGKFDWFNFLSYPYYVFRLESLLFGILFFSNVLFVFKKQWDKLWAFGMVLFYMLLFSLTAEKGARYLNVILPLMAMSVAVLIVSFYNEAGRKILKTLVLVIAGILIGQLSWDSYGVMAFKSDYARSISYVRTIDPDAKILSTQPLVQNLYTKRTDVMACPGSWNQLIGLYEKGYRYLVLCPQVYISWTDDKARFTTPLIEYLHFITERIKPMKVYAHFERNLLERFVFEHNENLRQSIDFLNSDHGQLGVLRIYDLGVCVRAVEQISERQKQKTKIGRP